MLKVKQARRSEQILVGGPGEDEVWPEKDMRQVLLARQRLEHQQKLDMSLDEIIQASRSAEADAGESGDDDGYDVSLDEIIHAARSAEADAGEAGDDDQADRQAAQGQQGAEAQGRGSWGTL